MQQSTNTPTGWVSCKLSFNSCSSREDGLRFSSCHREEVCHGHRRSLGSPSPPQIPGLGPTLTGAWGGRASMLAAWEETGRMLSWSSMTRHFLQDARDRINLREYLYSELSGRAGSVCTRVQKERGSSSGPSFSLCVSKKTGASQDQPKVREMTASSKAPEPSSDSSQEKLSSTPLPLLCGLPSLKNSSA